MLASLVSVGPIFVKLIHCQVTVFDVSWGTPVDLAKLTAVVKNLPDLKVYFFQGVETSTAISLPVEEISKLVQKHSKALTVVDAITSLCSEENQMDRWGVDCMIGGSQKVLGLVLVYPSWLLVKKLSRIFSQRPRFYFDFRQEAEVQEQGHTAWSSAVELVEALDFSLKRFMTLAWKILLPNRKIWVTPFVLLCRN